MDNDLITRPKIALPLRTLLDRYELEAWRTIARWGFEGLSILPKELVEMRERHDQQAFDVINETGLRLLVHAGLGNADDGKMPERIETVAGLIHTYQAGTGKVASLLFDPAYRIEGDRWRFNLEGAIQGLRMAQGLCEKDGIELGIENWPTGPFVADLEQLRDSIDVPLAFLLDIGHLFLSKEKGMLPSGSMEGFIRDVPLPIAEIHIHDNDGEKDGHWTLGEGQLPAERFIEPLAEKAKDAWYTLESRPGGEKFNSTDDAAFEKTIGSLRLLGLM